jgi:hypothetical protein
MLRLKWPPRIPVPLRTAQRAVPVERKGIISRHMESLPVCSGRLFPGSCYILICPGTPEKYRREMEELRRKAKGVSAALKAFRPIFEETVLIDHKHPRYQADLVSVVKTFPKIGERLEKFFAKFGAHLDEISARDLENDAAWCRSYRYEEGKDLEEAAEMLFKIQLSYMALERYEFEVWGAVSAHEVE